MKTRSSKRIDEYSSRINMYYLNYYYYYYLPPPFVIIVFIQTPVFCFLFFVFFLEAISNRELLKLYLLFTPRDGRLYSTKIIPSANGNVCTTYSLRPDSSIVEHTFASQRIYLSQIHVFDIDSYTLLIVIV